MLSTTLLPNSVESPAAAAIAAFLKPAGAPLTLAPKLRLNCRPAAEPTRLVVESCEAENDEICATERLLPWLANSEAVCDDDSFCRLCVDRPETVAALSPPTCAAESAATWLDDSALNWAAVRFAVPAERP